MSVQGLSVNEKFEVFLEELSLNIKELSKDMKIKPPVINITEDREIRIIPPNPVLEEIIVVKTSVPDLEKMKKIFKRVESIRGSISDLLPRYARLTFPSGGKIYSPPYDVWIPGCSEKKSIFRTVSVMVTIPGKTISQRLEKGVSIREAWRGFWEKNPGVGVRGVFPMTLKNMFLKDWFLEIRHSFLAINTIHPRLVAELAFWLHAAVQEWMKNSLKIPAEPVFPRQSNYALDNTEANNLLQKAIRVYETRSIAGVTFDEAIQMALDDYGVLDILGRMEVDVSMGQYEPLNIPRFQIIYTHEKPFQVRRLISRSEKPPNFSNLKEATGVSYLDVKKVDDSGGMKIFGYVGFPVVVDNDEYGVTENLGDIIKLFQYIHGQFFVGILKMFSLFIRPME